MKKDEINRRNFLKYLALIPVAFVGYLTDEMIKKTNFNNSKIITYPYMSINNGITFIDDFIFVKEKNKLKVYSAKCTHLGCKIKEFKNNSFVCPCHGSVFNRNGNVIKGPAIDDLTKLKYKIDKKKNQLKIYS